MRRWSGGEGLERVLHVQPDHEERVAIRVAAEHYAVGDGTPAARGDGVEQPAVALRLLAGR